jgi:2,3-dihydroxybenzoate-AMP ligase/mycobactin salicyl-AMP ligase
MTLGEMFDKGADLYPNKEALVDDENRLTYLQLREKVDRLAVGFMKLGIKKQDRVLLQLPNWGEFVYSYFALQKIGAIVVLLHPRHAPLEINHFCHLTDAVAWVVPETYRKIESLPIIDDVLNTNRRLKHIILVRGKESRRFIKLESLIRDAVLSQDNLRELVRGKPDPTEVAHMGPTGGTTGTPKVALRTHNDYICNVEYKAKAWDLNSRDSCVAMAPVGHDLTFTAAVAGSVFTSSRLLLLDSTLPEDFCEIVQREKATCAVMVPSLAERIASFKHLNDYDMSSLVKLHVGGGPSTPDLIKAFEEELGCRYVIGYGSTEGMNSMTRLDYDIDTVCSTSGRACCPDSEYRVVDNDERELPTGAVGELVIRGPDVFAGYLGSLEGDSTVFTKDGFFKSGDLAFFDHSGNIRIAGRIKDIILRGGENIIPAEIERLIMDHPAVDSVCVIGMPDKELGERICAYITPVSGSDLSFNDIISFLKAKGASVLQLPERIEFIDSIPLTKVGKIDKRALREDIKKRLGMA